MGGVDHDFIRQAGEFVMQGVEKVLSERAGIVLAVQVGAAGAADDQRAAAEEHQRFRLVIQISQEADVLFAVAGGGQHLQLHIAEGDALAFDQRQVREQ